MKYLIEVIITTSHDVGLVEMKHMVNLVKHALIKVVLTPPEYVNSVTIMEVRDGGKKT